MLSAPHLWINFHLSKCYIVRLKRWHVVSARVAIIPRYRFYFTLTASVLLAQIRKPPDIAQTDAVPDNTEEELHFPAPCRPVFLLRLLTDGNILTSGRHDRHVVDLAVVVQRSQLVPISSGLDYHSPVGLDVYTKNRSLFSRWVAYLIEIFNTLLVFVCQTHPRPRRTTSPLPAARLFPFPRVYTRTPDLLLYSIIDTIWQKHVSLHPRVYEPLTDTTTTTTSATFVDFSGSGWAAGVQQ